MSELIVNSAGGRLKGRQENGAFEFLGVPYAAAPAGELRWSAPQSREPWSGIRDCLQPGPQAWQPEHPASGPMASFMGETGLVCSEDCLNLNIWGPTPDGRPRPVFVWVHGGGFLNGSGAQPIYNGRTLATNGDIVVVTINYRLGALGFLDLVSATNGAIPATGDEGLLDVLAAVQWIKANIEAFGGDPENITLAGESAGAILVDCLLAMPEGKDLVRRAVLQSGTASVALTRARKAEIAGELLSRLGIAGSEPDALFACEPERLAMAGAQLQAELGRTLFAPGIDEDRLSTRRPGSASAFHFPVEELLIGTTRDEWAFFLVSNPAAQDWTRDDILDRCRKEFPGLDYERLYLAYEAQLQSAGRPSDPVAVYSEIHTDRVFKMPAAMLSDACAEAGVKVHHYLFEAESPALKGACHAVELGALWRNSGFTPEMENFFGGGPEAEAVARDVQRWWASFVHGNGVGDKAWEPWTNDNRRASRIGGGAPAMTAFPEAEAIWREIGGEHVWGRV